MVSVNSRSKPIAIVGAGELVSHVLRVSDEQPSSYRFNVFKIDRSTATHGLAASDLLDLVKLARVVAIALLDDGWLEDEQREMLSKFTQDVEQMTEKWRGARE